MKNLIPPTMMILGAILAFGTVALKLINPEYFANNETLVLIMFVLGAYLALFSIVVNLFLTIDD